MLIISWSQEQNTQPRREYIAWSQEHNTQPTYALHFLSSISTKIQYTGRLTPEMHGAAHVEVVLMAEMPWGQRCRCRHLRHLCHGAAVCGTHFGVLLQPGLWGIVWGWGGGAQNLGFDRSSAGEGKTGVHLLKPDRGPRWRCSLSGK
jgi:hypothetical protein